MKISYRPKFMEELKNLPEVIQRKFDKQIEFLKTDIRYPSLHAKKYEEAGHDIWQARVDKNVRFYFKIENDAYIFLSIKKHPK